MLALPPTTTGSPWYDSTALATLVAVIIGLATIFLAMRVIPKRRLSYGIDLVTSLLAAPSHTKGDLELRYKDSVLKSPYVVKVNMTVRGRQDIASEDYDDGRPLNLNLGCQIIELLEIESKPATAPVPPVTYEGTAIHVGPGLLVNRQKVTIAVLVDGGRPTLEIISPLKNVKLRKEREDDQEVALLMMGPQNALAIGVIAGLAAFYIQQFTPHPLNLIAGWLAVVLLFLAVACQVWMIFSLTHKLMKRSSHTRWLKRRKVNMTGSPPRDV